MDLYEYQGKQLFRQFGIPVSDGELVAEETPEALVRLHVDPLEGFQPWQARTLIYGAGVTDPSEQKQLLSIIGGLYRCFVETDAMLTEINPLIVTPEGEVKALDSKFTVDDNALYRHPDIAAMRDVEAADPLEALAREKGVTYVKLDGDVGILGNGAGLSMSTVDVVAHVGGRPRMSSRTRTVAETTSSSSLPGRRERGPRSTSRPAAGTWRAGCGRKASRS